MTEAAANMLLRLTERASTARVDRLPGWSRSVLLLLDGHPLAIVQNTGSVLAVTSPSDEVGRADTRVAVTAEGFRKWLDCELDFSHLVKSGDIRILGGTYFDVLLLSKALGLRPRPGAVTR